MNSQFNYTLSDQSGHLSHTTLLRLTFHSETLFASEFVFNLPLTRTDRSLPVRNRWTLFLLVV